MNNGVLFFLLERIALKPRKRYRVHELRQRRDNIGEFQNICTVLKNYPSKFHDYFRMKVFTFDHILNSIKDDLTR